MQSIKNSDGTETKKHIYSADFGDLVSLLDRGITNGTPIDELHIKGHGEKHAVYLVGGSWSSPSTYLGSPPQYFEIKNQRIFTSTGDDITQKFQDAMPRGSLLVLSGCETGRGAFNIAQQVSIVLPNVTVVGSSGVRTLGIPFSSNSIGGEIITSTASSRSTHTCMESTT